MAQCDVTQEVKNVVIVGGGTAGWLAAGVLASKLHSSINVTLIESPNIPTIGVGEGSWPSLRDTLIDIGISESDFLTTCSASFKQGSSFVNWRNATDKPHIYYHPFTVPSGYNELNIHACWQTFAKDDEYQDAFSLQAALCHEGRAPKQLSTPEYAHVLNYGYHFDASALALLLKKHCIEKLNVHYQQAHIAQVNTCDNGFIQSVTTGDGNSIKGDLFIDCSGQQGVLIEKHYKVPWQSVEHTLINNRAVAVQVPYAENDNAISSTTIATAQSNGWTWDIGLQHRRGIGLVYADTLTSEEAAIDTLLNQVSLRYPKNIQTSDVRTLRFSPGYRQQFWVKNCLSLGMSSGFVEPLEASAIAMVELGLRMLCDAFPQNRRHMELVAKRYNSRFTYRWQRVIDFLKLHYVLSDRTEPYWLAQREPSSIPGSLEELLEIWRYQSPSRLDLIENEEIFPSASYQYVLYGMGFNTAMPATAMTAETARKAQALRNKLVQTQQAYLAGLPTNRALLTQLSAQYSKEHAHAAIR